MPFPKSLPFPFPSALSKLTPKISFVKVNRDATVLVIKDVTGLYNTPTNTGGYGTPNEGVSDIDKVVFTVSSFTDDEVYTYEAPSKSDVVNGLEINITPQDLGADEGYSFEDGIYDINEYVISNRTLVDYVAVTGNKYVTFTTPILEVDYNTYNVIYDNNGGVYNIDKSKPFSPTNLALVEELKGVITAFNWGYRANVKAQVTVSLDYDLGTLSTSECHCNEQERLMKIYFHKAMAEIAMQNQDYKRANTLVSGKFNRGGC